MTNAEPNSSGEGKIRQDDDDSKATTVVEGSKKRASKVKQKRSVTSKAAKAASKKAPAKRAETATKSETLVTEKPVPLSPPKKTSEFVVTVDNSTGLPIKIEKFDSEKGERKELSEAEYLQMVSTASQQPLNYLGFGNTLGSEAESGALAQAYYRGVVDYLNALSSP